MEKRGSFSNVRGFILASVGSAVGLGSIWRFPYLVGDNGGAVFVAAYLCMVLLVGIPVLLAELAIGRSSQSNVYGAFRKLAPGSKFPWHWAGGLAIITCVFILAFYTVVSAWVTGYMFEAIRGTFSKLETPAQAAKLFESLTASPRWVLPFQVLFFAATALIVAHGVKKGIERSCEILMPILGVLLLGLAIWGALLPGGSEAFTYLFKPNSQLTTRGLAEALGQAFFNLSIGMGVMITYGSYLKKEENLLRASISIVVFDTLVSFLSAIAIFGLLFSMGGKPVGGSDLVFKVLPVFFPRMWGGQFFAVLFFGLLALTALAATISLLEVPVSYLVDERKWTRKKAAWTTAAASFLFLGIPCALSPGPLANFTWFFRQTFFDFLMFVSSNILLSVIALATTLFVGVAWGLRPARKAITEGSSAAAAVPAVVWKLLIWVVCPALIVLTLVAAATQYIQP
ncbi:MAG TPA: sodium-dependent transporter [Pyrinomonadaceae bacterium]